MRTFKNMGLMCLLSLTLLSTLTLSQDHTLPYLTGETLNWQSTEREASTFKATSGVTDIQKPSAAAMKDDRNRSATPPQQRLQFEVTTSLDNSGLMLPYDSTGSTNTSTEAQFEDTAPPSSIVTDQTSEPFSAETWMPTSPNQNQITEDNARSTSDDQTPTSPSLPTNIFSTLPKSSMPVNEESTRTNPSVKTTDNLLSILPSSTPKMLVLTTQAQKREDLPQNNSKKMDNPGIVVASIIGGALVMMIIGFIGIFIQRKKYKQQQVLTKDWAGPSPFLENTDNGNVNLMSSNRISFSSFLPQRLSRKLSLLPEEDQELEDIMTGTTFGGKQEAPFPASEQAENGLQKSNGTAAGALEVKIEGNSTESSSQANEEPPRDKNSEVTVQITDDPVTPLPPSGPAEDSST